MVNYELASHIVPGDLVWMEVDVEYTSVFVPVEVLNIIEDRAEVAIVGSDGTCIWVDKENLRLKTPKSWLRRDYGDK